MAHVDYQKAYEQLDKMIRDVRALQKEYFKKRDPQVLIRSKQAESKLDEFLNPPKQPKVSQATIEWLGQ